MGEGLAGGTSFMEDYTYDLTPGDERVLGAHMLEICPTIAADKPRLEIHPLGIGGKEDPVRLVFNATAGPALNASLIDLGNRFRLLINEVDTIEPPPMPKLPVARAVWKCQPDFKTACAAWILAGGAHHTAFSYSVTTEMLEDFATIAGIEMAVIGADTKIREFKQDLRNNDVYYHLAQGSPAEIPSPAAGGRGTDRFIQQANGAAMLEDLKREAYEANVALAATGSST